MPLAKRKTPPYFVQKTREKPTPPTIEVEVPTEEELLAATAVFDKSVNANKKILDSDIEIQEVGKLRIFVSFADDVTLSIMLTRDTTQKILNVKDSLFSADTLYVFDVPVRSGDLINFQVDKNTTVHVMNVDFI